MSCIVKAIAMAASLVLMYGNAPFAWSAEPPLAGDPFAAPPDSTGASLQGDPFADNGFENMPKNVSGDEMSSGAQKKPPWPFLQKGWLESGNQIRTRDDRAISLRQRLWLEGGHSFSPIGAKKSRNTISSARCFLSGSLDHDAAAASLSSDNDDLSADLHEAYLTIDTENADFLLGRKMVRWGTGDGINPLDLINPLDHRDPFASGRSDNRLPTFLGQGSFSLPTPGPVQELSLEVVVAPLAEVNRLSAPGSAWESEPLREIRLAENQKTLELAEQELPNQWFEEGKYLLHLAATWNGWDFGLAGYSGLRNDPVLVGSIDDEGKFRITSQHPQMTAVGLTFAKSLNRSTLRGELAFKPSYPMQKNDNVSIDFYRKDMIEGVIGIDRTFSTNIYINMQYFSTFIPENIDKKKIENGVTYEISDLFFKDNLKIGVSGIIGLSKQGWTIQPYTEYQIGDDWTVTLSILIFEGKKEGIYGQYDDNDFISLKLRRTF